jgi:hypothetical protein
MDLDHDLEKMNTTTSFIEIPSIIARDVIAIGTEQHGTLCKRLERVENKVSCEMDKLAILPLGRMASLSISVGWSE